jgi:rubrerythrin
MPTSTTSERRSPAEIRRWRQYLADERAEATIYRDLAGRRSGEEQQILLGLADVEKRHDEHWLALLGDAAGRPKRTDRRARPSSHRSPMCLLDGHGPTL